MEADSLGVQHKCIRNAPAKLPDTAIQACNQRMGKSRLRGRRRCSGHQSAQKQKEKTDANK